MKRLDSNGFSPVFVILIIAIAAIVVGTGWYVYKNVQETDKSSKAETNQQTAVDSDELKAGDFGSEGDFGTFQAEGYGLVLPELYDIDNDCGLSNPGVECPKINGVFFVITKTNNTSILPYLEKVKIESTGIPANSLVIGCPANDTITYINSSDTNVFKEYTIDPADTSKILNSNAQNTIKLEITKDKLSVGRDAPNCYSNFTNYKITE